MRQAETRPPSRLPGTKTQNPAYYRWYRERNIKHIKKRLKDYWKMSSPEFKKRSYAQKARYRAKNKGKISRSGARYYQRTKVKTLAKQKERRKDPEFKKRSRKYQREYKAKESETNARTYQKARILRQKGKKSKKKPGFVYFFKCITPGYYKAGCTVRWKKRQRAYSGPAAVEKLYFLRPVPDMFYAETQLKIFLENAGYKPCGKGSRRRITDWFTLN